MLVFPDHHIFYVLQLENKILNMIYGMVYILFPKIIFVTNSYCFCDRM